VHDRTNSEMSSAASISPGLTRPRPVEMKPSAVAGSDLDSGAGPFQTASRDWIELRCRDVSQWCRGKVPALVGPRHDIADGRIDETMAEAQPVIDIERGALDMKTKATSP
jgi:hypothetical protein